MEILTASETILSLGSMCAKVILAFNKAREEYTQEREMVFALQSTLLPLEASLPNLPCALQAQIIAALCTLNNTLEGIHRLLGEPEEETVLSRLVHRSKITGDIKYCQDLAQLSCSAVNTHNTAQLLYLEKSPRNGEVLNSVMTCFDGAGVTQQMLRNGTIYCKIDNFKDMLEHDQFVVLESKTFVAEQVPKCTTQKANATRKKRLADVAFKLSGQQLPFVLMPSKVVESKECFYLLSEMNTKMYTLEDKLPIQNDPMQVLLNIAYAIDSIHSIFILHKDLNSSHILIDEDGQVKLAGFIRSKMDGAPSDNAANSDPLQLRRELFFQAPERTDARGRYTKDCDIYSLGVVMLEFQLGFSLARSSLANAEEALMQANDSTDGQLLLLIRECMSRQASDRPSISEVVATLDYLNKLVESTSV